MRAVVLLCALASVANAEPALDKPAFTATPAELVALAKSAPRGTREVTVLRQDHDISYDDRGRATQRWRMVFVVATKDAISSWDTLNATWQPSYQDRPKVRARAIDPTGTVVELDQKRVTDSPAGHASTAAPDARRTLAAVLPPLQVGTIVEEEVVTIDREPLVGGGGIETAYGSYLAREHTIKISAPASRKHQVVARGWPTTAAVKPQTTGGRRTWSYAFATIPEPTFEPFPPSDARQLTYVRVSSAPSWNFVAKELAALVDARIAAGPVSLPAEVTKAASIDAARKLASWLHERVRATSVTLDDSSFSLTPPAEVIKRGSADIKDRAVLLVALLRQAGIRAELAMVELGPGSDVERELPGANAFDHAIVRATIGKTELWIDPDEPDLPVGVLPTFVQGRLALVVAAGTAGLVTTPVASQNDNIVKEVRTYDLAEAGYAKITERSHEGGVFAAEQRRWIRETPPDDVREQLADYMTSEFHHAKLDRYTTTDPKDTSKPFELTVVATGTQRAHSDRSQIDVYLFPTDALEKLPDLLENPKDDDKRRRFDLVQPNPHVFEIENRLVIPTGFTVPQAAPERVHELGTMKLVERQRVDGQTLVVTMRFETGKARLTPAEVAKAQTAVRALREEGSRHVVIELTSMALAKQGKLREAVAEVERLIKLHPREALHHQQLAQILLEAGAGEPARRAARKAVALEPNNADAHAVLGWVLQHDSFGRWLGFDHDRAGARAAYEKARKLDPKHIGAIVDLASLLERNAAGRRFELGSDAKAAAAQWRAVRELDSDVEHGYALIRALLWSGDAVEAEKVARSLPQADVRDQLLLAAIASGPAGPAGAVRAASTMASASTRTNLLAASGGILMLLRNYDAMRALFGQANALPAGSPQAAMMAKLRRHVPTKTQTPETVALDGMTAVLHPTRPTTAYWDTAGRDEVFAASKGALTSLRSNDLVTTTLVEDLMRSSFATKVDDAAPVWRVQIDVMTQKGVMYVARHRDGLKVIGDATAPEGVGRHVLRLVAQNDTKSAQQLLDWLSIDMKGPAAMAFSKVWGANLPRTKDAIELAAAVVGEGTDSDRMEPILKRCGATTKDGQLACDWTLVDVYGRKKRWNELETHAEAWAARSSPPYAPAIAMRARALAHIGNFDDADRLVADALATNPDDRMLIMARAEAAAARGKLPDAVRWVESMAKGPKAIPMDFNNAAWLKLVEGSDLAGALALIQQGLQQEPNEPHSLHTLATIHAERGELADARKQLHASFGATGDTKPGSAHLYVHARILEQLGFKDDAIALYRRIPAEATLLPDSDDLARRRLKALGIK